MGEELVEVNFQNNDRGLAGESSQGEENSSGDSAPEGDSGDESPSGPDPEEN